MLTDLPPWEPGAALLEVVTSAIELGPGPSDLAPTHCLARLAPRDSQVWPLPAKTRWKKFLPQGKPLAESRIPQGDSSPHTSPTKRPRSILGIPSILGNLSGNTGTFLH